MLANYVRLWARGWQVVFSTSSSSFSCWQILMLVAFAPCYAV